MRESACDAGHVAFTEKTALALGLVLPEREGPRHPYLGCSPACWALYGELLAREYGDPTYFQLHQLSIDTYAVQHPGVPERRSIQSVALHLITLCLVLERGAEPSDGPKLHRRLVKRQAFNWLEPPRPIGQMTVADVHRAPSAEEHERILYAWARDVWGAWGPHHATIHRWIKDCLNGG